MSLIKKDILPISEGVSATLSRESNDPYFYIFDPTDSSVEVPEGYDSIMFLVKGNKEDVLKLSQKLQQLALTLKGEAMKLPSRKEIK